MSILDQTGCRVVGRYLWFMVPASVAWEFAHMPFYTVWETGTRIEIAYAALHCSVGDLLIATGSLVLAVILGGARSWPHHHYLRVATLAVALGLSYTVFSEWLNIELRQTWAYREAMPRLPVLGTGLTPVLQWLILPPLGLWWARRGVAMRVPPAEGDKNEQSGN